MNHPYKTNILSYSNKTYTTIVVDKNILSEQLIRIWMIKRWVNQCLDNKTEGIREDKKWFTGVQIHPV